jgi:hypothetical protein
VTERRYESPEDFKRALEQRLRNTSSSGEDFARRRQVLVFERFLARVAVRFGDRVVLKGGLVLELRIERARTTKDVDLALATARDDILDELQELGRTDLGDFMTFEVLADAVHPVLRTDALQEDGLRFRVVGRLAGKPYGHPFGVDVAIEAASFEGTDRLVTPDVLSFADVQPATLRAVSVVTHLAEKLHAFTLPRPRPNSRVKDVPDIALLASIGPIDSRRLREALERTFDARRSHLLPAALPAPPTSWTLPYATMARDDRLPWTTLDDVERAAREFLDPVLAGPLAATWSPSTWTWSTR